MSVIHREKKRSVVVETSLSRITSLACEEKSLRKLCQDTAHDFHIRKYIHAEIIIIISKLFPLLLKKAQTLYFFP